MLKCIMHNVIFEYYEYKKVIMNSMRIKGIIIREVPFGEADKILTILSKEHGLITVSAKNARRPRNNMLFSTSALIYGEFEITGNELSRYYLNQVTIIESFAKLRDDIILLTYCAHIMDVVMDALRDSSSSLDIYTLLMYTLITLGKENKDKDLIVHTFEIKLLALIGFLPVLNECVLCNKPVSNEAFSSIIFSYSHCGVCCHDVLCASKAGDYQIISLSTWNCLCYISVSPIEKLYSFTLDKPFVVELSNLATRYICERLERCYTKLRMLKDF